MKQDAQLSSKNSASSAEHQADKQTTLLQSDPEQEEKSAYQSPEQNTDSWLLMTEDWQSQTYTKIDIAKLLKQTQRRTLWAKICLVINIALTFLLLLVFVYGVSLGNFSTVVNIYIGIGSIIALIFSYFEVKIRRKAWQTHCDSPDKAVENAKVGIESSIKYCRLTQLSLAPFVILLNWFIYAITIESDNVSWLPWLIGNGYLLLVYIVTEVVKRKRQVQYQQLLQASEE